ncbi:SDR family NAD(P)-dependent oxidoreductase [Micromonospora trifolii]|uniref:SDR family NAD(P)-dependent oxidoreductase n=1 Tax=Micromonospora trifolii TaxID=2911208 RepID=UPI003D2ED879
MIIRGKTALVTGASRGIGAEVARMLAAEGARVAVSYNQSKDAAAKVRDGIVAAGGEARSYRADLAMADQAERLVSSVIDDFGQIDILVNNAGAILRPGNWDTQDLDRIDETLNLNLRAPLLMTRHAANGMSEAGAGVIINFSSTYGITGGAAVLAYTAAKSGVISMTYSMARELGPKGIRVNAVVPGNIDTDMTRGAGDQVVQWAINTTPLGRLGTVQEVASSVKFLIENDFISGHALVVDGGQILNM